LPEKVLGNLAEWQSRFFGGWDLNADDLAAAAIARNVLTGVQSKRTIHKHQHANLLQFSVCPQYREQKHYCRTQSITFASEPCAGTSKSFKNEQDPTKSES